MKVYVNWSSGKDAALAFFEAQEAGRDIVCLTATIGSDGAVLDRSFAGREFDGALLADLPQGVDPCGGNGEFHTFVYDGPIFKRPVPFTIKGVEALRYPEVEHPYWRCIIE